MEKIKNLMNNTISRKSRILFKEVEVLDLKLYFTFEEITTIIYKNVSSFEVKPLGFIFEKEEWIFVPFDESFNNEERIIREFVKRCL